MLRQCLRINLPAHVGESLLARRGFWRLTSADITSRIKIHSKKIQRLAYQCQVLRPDVGRISAEIFQDICRVAAAEDRVHVPANVEAVIDAGGAAVRFELL